MAHVVTVQRYTSTVDEYGTPVKDWTDLARLRAEVIERSTEEFIRDVGVTSTTSAVFRTRYLAGLTNADRVVFDGENFNIREVTPIGRRKGLELRCEAMEGT